MVDKKKAKRKHPKSKTTVGKKMTATKKTAKNKLVLKEKTPKRLAKKKAPQKKAAATKVIGKKTTTTRTAGVPKKKGRKRNQGTDRAFSREGKNQDSGRQSGDLQGLSSLEGADSESVGELLEEGNAFEADAVKGVEDAGRGGVREVRTHEVPEDDVPEEYFEKE